MALYEQLRQHQDRAHAVMDRVCAILADPAPDVMALGQARWELARVLRGYQIFKHGTVFDPIIATGPFDRVAVAQDMKARCIRMGERFTAHILHWSAVSVRDVMEEYRPDALEMIGALRDHLAHERDGIARLEEGDPMPAHAAAAPWSPFRTSNATMRF